eukprot:1837270-Alexandrium_andersonii.AAC.1
MARSPVGELRMRGPAARSPGDRNPPVPRSESCMSRESGLPPAAARPPPIPPTKSLKRPGTAPSSALGAGQLRSQCKPGCGAG